ncbi:MAG: hypothetical protein KJ593_04460 [Candidatus Omnitrophica bacterium]|nr:hypothetical protein [Candidatus Omnitrophota bacterium]
MKKLTRFIGTSLFILTNVVFSGCASTSSQLLEASESQVQLRSMQTRAFDTTDKKKMLRTIISTLQDLDFVIDRADQVLGSVTGSKFTGNAVVKMSITVRPRGDKQLLVRANAQYGIKAIEDPEPYQDFFNALGKAIFLTAHQVD